MLFNIFFAVNKIPKIFMSGIVVVGIISNSKTAKASIIDANSNSAEVYLANLTAISENDVNSLSAEIAKLEIERVLLLSRYTINSTPVKNTENKIKDARNRYIQVGGNNVLLNHKIINALVRKIASLEVATGLLYARYPQDSPQIKVAESDIKGLRDRFWQFKLTNSKSIINTAVSQALKSKIAELKKEIVQLKKKYQQDSVEVITAEEQVNILQKRLARYR